MKSTKKNQIYSKSYSNEINSISSQFLELFEEKKENLESLELNILKDVIDNDQLQLETEDRLLYFINNLYVKDNKYSILFEAVFFSNASFEMVKKFIYILYFRYLWYIWHQQTHGNINDNGTIKITSNSISDNSEQPKNLVDYENDNNFYHSNNTSNIFIQFDFKDKLIQLTNYSIRSRESNKNGAHIRNWVVEVSNDGENWEKIDEHVNDSTLKNKSVAVFKTKKQDDFYRYIQLRQTGEGWSGDYYFAIYCFDIFGKLKIFNK